MPTLVSQLKLVFSFSHIAYDIDSLEQCDDIGYTMRRGNRRGITDVKRRVHRGVHLTSENRFHLAKEKLNSFRDTEKMGFVERFVGVR